MLATTLENQEKLIGFVKQAVKRFGESPGLATFGDVRPGEYLALRWGMGEDCVLVIRLDKNFEPINFHQAILPRNKS